MKITPDKDAPIPPVSEAVDLLVIGGGVNGCGIARDAAGRGLSVVLCEKDDLAQATSSASTKLFHGGLRYLEYFEFRLVREALIEREVLYRAMPHISWPLRFVLPVNDALRFSNEGSPFGKFLSVFMPFLGGRRPAWLTRLGLFLYDHIGGRHILRPTKTLDLKSHPAGKALKPGFSRAFEYSDCWVEDARLVVLNARDAALRGARIYTRTIVEEAHRRDGGWVVHIKNTETGAKTVVRARGLVNAGGPWIEDIIQHRLNENGRERVRLVRGSHIVTRRLFTHDQPYFLQLSDGRIIFAIPYETDFTLIGTTDHDHEGDPGDAVCTPEERDYLLNAINQYFEVPVTRDDIVWTYSGVRPLYDDEATDATAATRDYVLSVHDENGAAPLLNVFGGKITTFRKLAQEALNKLKAYYPHMGDEWTRDASLPGGDFPYDGVTDLIGRLRQDYPFLTETWARRLVRAYGTDAFELLDTAARVEDLGQDFGANLTEREVDWLMDKEWAMSAEDIVWRRSKIGLRLSASEIATLDAYMHNRSVAEGVSGVGG